MSALRSRSRPAASGWIEPCQPTSARRPPVGGGWIHEIKHDGYRLMVSKDGAGIRLLTRRGIDWTERFPLVRAAANAIKAKSFLIDGEAVCVDDNGVTDFSLLRRRKHPVILYAFDLLQLGGRDLRAETIEYRKAALAKLLRIVSRDHSGIAMSEHIEAPADVVFEHACRLGLEGIVSKRIGSRYRSGPSSDWLKSKNPNSPAVVRESTEDWSRKRR